MFPGIGELKPNNLTSSASDLKANQKTQERPDKRSNNERDDFDSYMSKKLEKENSPRMKDRQGTEKLRDESKEEQTKTQTEKQAAMLKFMDSMENELGIDPEELLQAMQSQDSGSGSEVSMAQAMASLDIDPENVDRAAELYATMLVSIGYKGQEPLKNLVPVSDMNFHVMTQEQMRKDQLASNVDVIQNSFFVNEKPKSPLGDSGLDIDNAIDIGAETDSFVNRDLNASGLKKPLKLPDMMNLKPQETAVNSSAQSDFGKNTDAMAHMTSLMTPTKGVDADQLNGLLNPQSFQKAPAMPAEASAAAASATQLQSMDAVEENISFMPDSSGSFSGESFSGSSENTGSQGDGMQGSLGGEGIEATGAEAEISEAFVVPTTAESKTASTAELSKTQSTSEPVEIENVQEIIDQAQVMIRKGGGEMKVSLNSSGLGEVNLKVNVQDGNVDIQMVAEHSEAKRALEKGLGELKANLAQQKLNVEALNVDVSTDLSGGSDADKEAEQDHAREFARDFMGKSRDGNQSFKQSFLSTPFQGYFQQEREEINPVEPLAQMSARSIGGNSSGRLNLVA